MEGLPFLMIFYLINSGQGGYRLSVTSYFISPLPNAVLDKGQRKLGAVEEDFGDGQLLIAKQKMKQKSVNGVELLQLLSSFAPKTPIFIRG
jgi:hypothetical protein